MPRQRLMLFLPLIGFVCLVVLFVFMQREMGAGRYDPQALPSALLNHSLPAFELPRLTGSAEPGSGGAAERIASDELVGEVALLNVWATWCPTCHYEHPYLNQLAEQGVVIYGVNYKDDPAKARQWLLDKGDPYRAVIDDRAGRLGLDLGVTGAPETYVIDHRGIVRMRYQGALDEGVWNETIGPLVRQLQAEQAAAGRSS